jgi:asparagine synthase (glutamine-hydrolysing)
MCGIAGIWNLNGNQLDPEVLKEFTDSIQSRGPDGAGYELFHNNTFGLGHRRLSILDLSELGHQPMHSADGRYVITYNGEVFNFQEIREELQGKGHQFRSNTDTEVIMAAWAEWGTEAFHKFNGMWAFAIWDKEERTLTLSRDRFGIKPLYYLWMPNKILAFASETYAFKFLRGFERSISTPNFKMAISGVPLAGSGHSIYNGIDQLLPGHLAVIKENGEFKQKRWWHILEQVKPCKEKTFEEQKEHFYELFRDACKRRLISDVPIGTALSGGLDSTSVYSTVYDIINKEQLSRTHSNAQTAFVATFPGLPMDERKYAEEAVKFTGGPVVYLADESKDLVNRCHSV